MERATTELLLPDSQAKIILYSYLVNGDYKIIQKKLAGSVTMQLGDDGKPLPGEAEKMKSVSMAVMLLESEATQQVLIKDIVLADGAKVVDIKDFIYNLSLADGKALDSKTEEIGRASNLSADAKKK